MKFELDFPGEKRLHDNTTFLRPVKCDGIAARFAQKAQRITTLFSKIGAIRSKSSDRPKVLRA
jgi:hypothetical protein